MRWGKDCFVCLSYADFMEISADLILNFYCLLWIIQTVYFVDQNSTQLWWTTCKLRDKMDWMQLPQKHTNRLKTKLYQALAVLLSDAIHWFKQHGTQCPESYLVFKNAIISVWKWIIDDQANVLNTNICFLTLWGRQTCRRVLWHFFTITPKGTSINQHVFI